MELDDQLVLVDGPLSLADVGVQVIVPSLTALLSNATWQALGNLSPVFGALSHDDSSEDSILFFGPGPLGEVATVVQLEPARVALDLRLAREQLTDAIPGVLAEAFYVILELLILYHKKAGNLLGSEIVIEIERMKFDRIIDIKSRTTNHCYFWIYLPLLRTTGFCTWGVSFCVHWSLSWSCSCQLC